MKQYWMSLQPRERLVLGGGGAVLLLVLIYLIVIEPFVNELNRLEQSVASQQAEVAWMRAASDEIKKLRASGAGKTRGNSSQSLLSLIDSSARAKELGKALQQLSPVGDKVRVRLELAPFDSMVLWIDQLEKEAGVAVDSLSMERLDSAGMVNATIVLGRGGAV